MVHKLPEVFMVKHSPSVATRQLDTKGCTFDEKGYDICFLAQAEGLFVKMQSKVRMI